MAAAEDRFKPGLVHLFPVLLGLVITGVLGYPPTSQGVKVQNITYFQGDTFSGASLNALYFVLALGASATAMFILVRRGRMRFLRTLLKAALMVVCFSTVVWYGSVLFATFGSALDEPFGSSLLFAMGAVVTAVLGYLIFGKAKRGQLIAVAFVSSFTGLFLGASIPILTVLVLAVALVLYDIVAVFKGPIGALAKSTEIGELPGAMFNYRELAIGMGDMVFYSLVATAALWNYGLLAFLAAGVGIIAGTFLGFKALQKFDMFPGLPFSLLLGVAGMLVVVYL